MDEYLGIVKPFLAVLHKRERERSAAAHILRMSGAVTKLRRGSSAKILVEAAAFHDSGDAWSEVRRTMFL